MASQKHSSKDRYNIITLYSILKKIGNISSAERAAYIFGRIMVALDYATDETEEFFKSNEIFMIKESKEIKKGLAGPYIFKDSGNEDNSENEKDSKKGYKLFTEASNKQMRNFVNRRINEDVTTDKSQKEHENKESKEQDVTESTDSSSQPETLKDKHEKSGEGLKENSTIGNPNESKQLKEENEEKDSNNNIRKITGKDSNNNIRRIIAKKLECSLNENAKGETIKEIEDLIKIFIVNKIDRNSISDVISEFKSEEYSFVEENEESKREELRKYALSLNAIKNYILSFDDLYTKLAWIFLVSCFPTMPENPKNDYLIEIIFPALGLEITDSELKHDAEDISQTDNSEYAKFINETKLPSELDKIENIFSFRSNKIEFQGRKNELEKLNEWLIQGNVSVWAITGQGGSGKSRLALQFATQVEDDIEKESIGKAVWIDNEMLDKLLTFNDFSYPKPVLFICDYAANYEEKLSAVVDKISRTQANAKFLLIERSNSWYSGFLQKNGVVNEFAEEEPIFLDDLDFTSEEYSAIMQDFSDALYVKGAKKIANEAQNQIVQKAKELSGNEHSARCLFLLLVTEAYLRDSDISRLSAQDLLHNYFDHSRKILSRQYEDDILKAGYRVLAYATACGGISFSDVKNHPAIQNEWNNIKEQLKNRSDFNQFFQRISEIDEKDTVPAMKPDLIGEFLFLHEWNELIDEQNDWLFNLLKQDYSRSFFAMCISDWKEESRTLIDLLSDQNADTEQLVACAKVFSRVVCEIHSQEERKEYAAKIKAFDNGRSVAILNTYLSVFNSIFEFDMDSIESECMTWLNEINWAQYIYETTEDQLDYAEACFFAGIWYFYSSYNLNKAIEFFNKALTISEKVLGMEPPTTYITKAKNIIGITAIFGKFVIDFVEMRYKQAVLYYKRGAELLNIGGCDKALECFNDALEILKLLGTEDSNTATLYNEIGFVYLVKGEYDKALECYFQALSIYERVFGTNHPDTAMTYSYISYIYYHMGNYDKAEEYKKKREESLEHYRQSEQMRELE